MSDLLSPKQRAAIKALAGGANHDAAAAAADVSPRTLYRWRRDPVFMAGLREADSDALGEVARVLNTASRTAVDMLVSVINDPKSSPGLKVRAAGEILRHRAVFFEAMTLSEDVAELRERIADEQKNEPTN